MTQHLYAQTHATENESTLYANNPVVNDVSNQVMQDRVNEQSGAFFNAGADCDGYLLEAGIHLGTQPGTNLENGVSGHLNVGDTRLSAGQPCGELPGFTGSTSMLSGGVEVRGQNGAFGLNGSFVDLSANAGDTLVPGASAQVFTAGAYANNLDPRTANDSTFEINGALGASTENALPLGMNSVQRDSDGDGHPEYGMSVGVGGFAQLNLEATTENPGQLVGLRPGQGDMILKNWRAYQEQLLNPLDR